MQTGRFVNGKGLSAPHIMGYARTLTSARVTCDRVVCPSIRRAAQASYYQKQTPILGGCGRRLPLIRCWFWNQLIRKALECTLKHVSDASRDTSTNRRYALPGRTAE